MNIHFVLLLHVPSSASPRARPMARGPTRTAVPLAFLALLSVGCLHQAKSWGVPFSFPSGSSWSGAFSSLSGMYARNMCCNTRAVRVLICSGCKEGPCFAVDTRLRAPGSFDTMRIAEGKACLVELGMSRGHSAAAALFLAAPSDAVN